MIETKTRKRPTRNLIQNKPTIKKQRLRTTHKNAVRETKPTFHLRRQAVSVLPRNGKRTKLLRERERERFRREKSGKKVMSFHLQKSEANKNEWIGRLTFSRDCL